MTHQRLAQKFPFGTIRTVVMSFGLPIFLTVNVCSAQKSPLSNQDANRVAREVLQNEIAAESRDKSLWSFHEIQEKDGVRKAFDVRQTRNGEVQRLVSINGQPLTAKQRREEDQRIHRLLTNPDQMRREAKKQHEDAEQARSLLKIFPDAFRFQFVGMQGPLLLLKFVPNPQFQPSGRPAQVFHDMQGTLLVDPRQKRLVEIRGQLTQDVKFGGGMLGHLDKGGTFVVKQQDFGAGHWETTLLDVQMDGKALFFKTIAVKEKTVSADFQPIADGTDLKRAAELSADETPSTMQASKK